MPDSEPARSRQADALRCRNKDDQPSAGSNAVTFLKARVVQGLLVGSFSFLLFGQRICRLRTRTRDELLVPAPRILRALLPLVGGQRGIGNAFQFLREKAR